MSATVEGGDEFIFKVLKELVLERERGVLEDMKTQLDRMGGGEFSEWGGGGGFCQK
jgi:hypothetical protein